METWQKLLQAGITRPGDLTRRFGGDPRPLEQVAERYPMRVNPYYLSLIQSVGDPIWRQAVPAEEELQDGVCPADPLEEENQSPVPNLVHRYPDRVLFLISHECAMYCRFCTRKRKVGGEHMVVNQRHHRTRIGVHQDASRNTGCHPLRRRPSSSGRRPTGARY